MYAHTLQSKKPAAQSSKTPPIIHYDYALSPYGQKTKLLLDAAGLPFKRVDQPVVLPRKDLEDLGITYRRIPVVAVGKDVYCDSGLIYSVILGLNGQPGLAQKKVPSNVATDRAWEAWGTEAFHSVLSLAPTAIMTDDFIKDRETVFPILARSDYKLMRPSGVAELRSRLSWLETNALTNGTFLGGNELSVADTHIIWALRWALKDLGAENEAGLGKENFPKLWKLMDSLPEPKPDNIDAAEAKKTIEGAEYYSGDVGIEKGDPLGLEAGTKVTVESADAAPNSHPQAGKLLGSTKYEVILGLDNGIRLHFPREGYLVKKA